jgi:hypothetical protein
MFGVSFISFVDRVSSNNIPSVIMLRNIVFIFDQPIIFTTATCIGHLDNSFWCVLGLDNQQLRCYFADWSVENMTPVVILYGKSQYIYIYNRHDIIIRLCADGIRPSSFERKIVWPIYQKGSFCLCTVIELCV